MLICLHIRLKKQPNQCPVVTLERLSGQQWTKLGLNGRRIVADVICSGNLCTFSTAQAGQKSAAASTFFLSSTRLSKSTFSTSATESAREPAVNLHTAPPLPSVEEHKESNTKRAAAAVVDVVVGQVQCYGRVVGGDDDLADLAQRLILGLLASGYHGVGSKTLLRNRPSKYALDQGLRCVYEQRSRRLQIRRIG